MLRLGAKVFQREFCLVYTVRGISNLSETLVNSANSIANNAKPGQIFDSFPNVSDTVTTSKISLADLSANLTGNTDKIIEPILNIPLNALGEPALSSYNLGHNTPAGLVETIIENFHVWGLPWWGSIIATTCCIRFLLFPLMIKNQRNSIKMANYMPQIQKYQMAVMSARQEGDYKEVLRNSLLMKKLFQQHDIRPIRSMLMPLLQAPVFISMFFGLRAMAQAPIESMKNGGILWFPDLTIPDPYYALPIITAATLFFTIELGTEGMQPNAAPYVKWFLRAMPIGALIFSLKFQAAILCYWCCNNFLSLLQVGFLRIPGVRTYFGIERKIKHNMPESKGKTSSKMSFKESMNNASVLREIEDRQRTDAFQFKQAGLGPVPKTYDYDPTGLGLGVTADKINIPSSSVSTKTEPPVIQYKEHHYGIVDGGNNLGRSADILDPREESKVLNELRQRITQHNR